MKITIDFSSWNLSHIRLDHLTILMILLFFISLIGFTYELNGLQKWRYEVETMSLKEEMIFQRGMDKFKENLGVLDYEIGRLRDE